MINCGFLLGEGISRIHLSGNRDHRSWLGDQSLVSVVVAGIGDLGRRNVLLHPGTDGTGYGFNYCDPPLLISYEGLRHGFGYLNLRGHLPKTRRQGFDLSILFRDF